MIEMLHNRKMLLSAGSMILVVVATLAIVLIVSRSRGGVVASIVARAPVTTSPVSFGPGLTFSPAPSTDAYTGTTVLSAQAAYADYAAGKAIPADLNYQLGSLTNEPAAGTTQGDGANRPNPTADNSINFSNRPVWAFVLTGGPCDAGYGTTPLPAPASGCTTWAFVDASTGQPIMELSQPS